MIRWIMPDGEAYDTATLSVYAARVVRGQVGDLEPRQVFDGENEVSPAVWLPVWRESAPKKFGQPGGPGTHLTGW